MKSCIIPKFENYTIYENGEVHSKVRKGGGGIIKHTINVDTGYYFVNLTKDSKNYPKLLHRLLGMCFIENPENKPCIDHIDRNRTNNSLDNLRWATYKENNCNKTQKGSIHINKHTKNGKTYEYIRLTWYENSKRKSKNFKSMEDAEEFREKIVF